MITALARLRYMPSVMHKHTSFNPGQRRRTETVMIIADALTEHFWYTDADISHITVIK
jgi:hypothetical protein